jgi:hypothetical protein
MWQKYCRNTACRKRITVEYCRILQKYCRNTASMHRGFRPEEGFFCCMRAMTANRLYYLRSLKYKEI